MAFNPDPIANALLPLYREGGADLPDTGLANLPRPEKVVEARYKAGEKKAR